MRELTSATACSGEFRQATPQVWWIQSFAVPAKVYLSGSREYHPPSLYLYTSCYSRDLPQL